MRRSIAVIFLSTVTSFSSALQAGIFNIAAGDVAGLIEAMELANADVLPDTIFLDAGVYPIAQVHNATGGNNGLPVVETPIYLYARGGTAVVGRAAGAPSFRIFNVSSEGSLGLVDLEVVGGVAVSGAGLANHGQTFAARTVFRNNHATAGGGAIINNPDALLSCAACEVRTNRSDVIGGGVVNAGYALFSGCAFVDNLSESNGGGVFNIGDFDAVNSTFSGNEAYGNGGAIFNFASSPDEFGRVFVNSSTIADNLANADFDGLERGGSIYNTTFALVEIQGTLIARNAIGRHGGGTTGNGGFGTFTSLGYNLLQTLSGVILVGDLTGNVINQDPKLGPLGANGGPTPTHRILAGSPAIDAGSPDAPDILVSAPCQTTDQRGVSRPRDGDHDGNARADIGAYEFGALVRPPIDDFEVELAGDPRAERRRGTRG